MTATYDDLVAVLRAAGCVFAEDEARLLVEHEPDPERLDALVARRVAGEPLEHLVGWVDFAGLRIAVEPGVFVPRQRTAYLVDLTAAATPPGGLVVDLCCGSGALGLAVASRVAGVELHAVDVEPAAVACARRNLAGVGTAYAGDLVAPLPDRLRGRVDVLLANVPYVPSDAVALMPPESRDHEPLVTVDGGYDGLDVMRRVATLAPEWLGAGGTVWVETSEAQADAAAAAFAAAGLVAVVHHQDETGATVVSGRAGGR